MGFTLKINTDSAVYYWTVMCVLQGDIKSHGTMCPKDTQALSGPCPRFASLAHISGIFVWSLRALGSLGNASITVQVLWAEDGTVGHLSQNPVNQKQRTHHPLGGGGCVGKMGWSSLGEISGSKRRFSGPAWPVLNARNRVADAHRNSAADVCRPCSHNVWVKSPVLEFS